MGLLRAEEGTAAKVLAALGITVDRVRAQVSRIVGTGEGSSGQIPFTPRAKNAMALALEEADAYGSNRIETEHLLLGLVRESEGVAARILLDLDAYPDKLVGAVRAVTPGSEDPQLPRTGRPGPALERVGLRETVVDGAGPALQALVEEVEERSDRQADSGDLLVLLANVPDGLAARTLAAVGIDAGKLATATAAARRQGGTSALLPSPESGAEIEAVRAKRGEAMARVEALRAEERRLLEEELQRIEGRQALLLEDLRELLDTAGGEHA